MSPSLAAEARKSKGVHYYHPRIPFDIRLPGPLTAGSPIYVHGAVVSSPTRFCINLKDGEGAANVLFHYNPRFDEGVVVRNHFNNQAWGSEERDGENPLVPGCTFLLTIMADETAYEVKLNGETSVTFQSRDEMPLSSITHLEMKGDVVVYAIIIPTSSMSIPLHLNIPAQVHVGDQIIVSGDVPSDANRFTMNLQCSCDDGSDRIFHFNPRFGDGVIVCNTRCGDQWDEEVREGLMIGPGQPFVWSVGASTEAYHTFLNNQKAVKFNHRLDKSSASVLRVNGDVAVNNVQISCPPNQLPPAMTDSAREFDESAVAVSFCEALPFQLALPGPLQPGQMIVLSCYICPDPTRFTVNLQCGEKCHDRALHFNPRWNDDAGAVIVMNSKINDEWGSEERFENNLEANTYATVIIYCKNDGYTIAIDDEIIVPLFEHRMDCQSVTHVIVDGCILVQRIFAA